MKNKLWLNILAVSALAFTNNLTLNSSAQAQGVTFVCATDQNGSPATVARTPQGDVPIVVWKTEKGGGFTPEKRCEIVSAKFQDFHTRGILKFMTTGRENRQNVICVTTTENGNCEETLYTISDQKADPGQKLQQLLDVRLQATGPISETNGRIYIDMNQYLKDATAAGLIIPNNITPTESNPIVNPRQPNGDQPSTPTPLW
jgi:Circadian oscillating protein COP23